MNCSKSQGNQQLSELIIVSTLHDKSVMPPHPNGDHTETRKFELENENPTEPLALVTCWFFTLAADSAWLTAIATTEVFEKEATAHGGKTCKWDIGPQIFSQFVGWVSQIIPTSLVIDCREDVDSITTMWAVTGRLRNKAKETQDE